VPGEPVTFTLSYANVGGGTVYDVEVRDALPEGFVSPTLTASPTGPALHQLPGQQAAWRIERLRPGERWAITLGLRVDTTRRWTSATVLTNTASVSAPLAADATPADNVGAATVEVVPAAVYTVTVSGPAELPVGGATGSVTAQVTDRFGNPAADGTAVFFSTDRGSIQPEVTTTRDGAARATFTTGTRAGLATLRALSLEQRGGFSRVRIVPGPATRLDIASRDDSLPVGGATTVLTATLQDEHGNAIADEPLELETDLGLLSVTRGRTDARGQLTSTLWSGVRTGRATVTARGAFLTRQHGVEFHAGPPDELDLVAVPPETAIGVPVRVEARVRDEFENAVPGVEVQFSATHGALRFQDGPTGPDGRAVNFLTPQRAGPIVVRASAAGRTATTVVLVTQPRVLLPFLGQRRR
jgi:uncharacterized repeat protein (TIGR01451 family)